MPKSALTGTEKKAKKRELNFAKEQQKLFQKEQKKAVPYQESARHFEKQIQKGRHLPEYEKTGYKKTGAPEKVNYKKTGYENVKYNPHDIKQLTKDFEKAGRGAESMFAKQKENALAEFNQRVRPGVAGQFAPNQYGSSSGSSAMNQALAAAEGNLQRALNSDYESLRTNLASNILGQQEQQRQFGSQFQAGQNQFASTFGAQQNQYQSELARAQNQFNAQFRSGENQFGSQFRNAQNQFATSNQLAGLDRRLQSASRLSGMPSPPASTGLASQASYLPHSNAPSRGAGALQGGLQGAISGFAAGGPIGAVVGGVGGAGIGYFSGGQGGGQVGQLGGSALGNYFQNQAAGNAVNSAISGAWK